MILLSKSSGGLRPETRLRYLAQVLEYEVEFSDFPKVLLPYTFSRIKCKYVFFFIG